MLRLIVAIPLLIILVLFALSNRQPVDLAFWPTDYVLTGVPLAIAILIGAAIAFFLGALILWFALLAAKGRAARAERARRMLEEQVRELKARPVPATTRPGTAVAVTS
ncbi:MAG: DUF1049 domain-containing protein [Acetobacteraceae bacterium]|nr:DUF1049 domain-containing protein [Acetobacteraceae bacterium]